MAHLTDGPGPLPDGSPFSNLTEARRFAGPLPYTFDYEEATDSIIGIRAIRQQWEPEDQSLSMCGGIHFWSTSHSSAPVRLLANAFYAHDVPYRWEQGRQLS